MEELSKKVRMCLRPCQLEHSTTIWYPPNPTPLHERRRLGSSLSTLPLGFHCWSSPAPPARPYLKWIKRQHTNTDYSRLGTFRSKQARRLLRKPSPSACLRSGCVSEKFSVINHQLASPFPHRGLAGLLLPLPGFPRPG